MASLFKERTTRFGALCSLIILCGIVALFGISLPELVQNRAGIAFAALWAAFAGLVFFAHFNQLFFWRASQRRAVRLCGYDGMVKRKGRPGFSRGL